MNENRNTIFVVTGIVVLLLKGVGCAVFYGEKTKKTGPVRKMGQRSGKLSVTKEISETPIPSAASWSIAKQSGRKEDVEAECKRELDAYTKERNVPKGKMKKVHYYSKVIGEKREVYVYTPPQYSKDKKYPVLYLLHGIGCDGSQWISMKADNVLDNMIADGESVPCVVVCPSITPKKNKRTTQAISPENIEAYEKFDRELTEDVTSHRFSSISGWKARISCAISPLNRSIQMRFGIAISALAISEKFHTRLSVCVQPRYTIRENTTLYTMLNRCVPRRYSNAFSP